MLDPFACSLDPFPRSKVRRKLRDTTPGRATEKRRLASATSGSHYRRAVAVLSRYAKLLLGRSSMSDPLESRKDLVRYFEDGAKPPEKWRIGTEYEKSRFPPLTAVPCPSQARAASR